MFEFDEPSQVTVDTMRYLMETLNKHLDTDIRREVLLVIRLRVIAKIMDVIEHPELYKLEVIKKQFAEDLRFVRDFQKAPKKKVWRAARFAIEDSPFFYGYTQGDTWNGWAQPYFEFDQACRIMSMAYPNGWIYNSTTGVFTAEDADVGDVDEWPKLALTIEIEGVSHTKELWAIGNGAWIWDELDFVE